MDEAMEANAYARWIEASAGQRLLALLAVKEGEPDAEDEKQDEPPENAQLPGSELKHGEDAGECDGSADQNGHCDREEYGIAGARSHQAGTSKRSCVP
jgi:hypothetical protein